jgi:hypothetical protein
MNLLAPFGKTRSGHLYCCECGQRLLSQQTREWEHPCSVRAYPKAVDWQWCRDCQKNWAEVTSSVQ